MEFENEETALYFSAFANTTLDKKHKIRETERKKILSGIKNGNIPGNLDNFITAFVGCSAICRNNGKDKINKEAIEKYFLGPHNIHSVCKAYEGKVTKTTEKQAMVRTSEGEFFYKSLLVPSVKVGDNVIVHGRYIIGERK
jgi:hypothetical protein